MADFLIARGESEAPRLDTISYYDSSNPILDEQPYFTRVEQKRGRNGYHIDFGAKRELQEIRVDSSKSLLSACENCGLVAIPKSNVDLRPELLEHYRRCLRSQEYRVMLSGSAGEDSTGGFVPTPTPELQNLLASARVFRLARQLNAWAAKMGKPRLPLLWAAVRGFLTPSLRFPGAPKDLCLAPWFHPRFVRRNWAPLCWYPFRIKLFGALPSIQNQLHLLDHERRFVAHRTLSSELHCEIRYPYLDRDLLEFACAIPREQLVGVGKRHGVGEVHDATRIALRLPAFCGAPTREEAAQVLEVSVARQHEFTSAFTSLTQQRREVLGHPERLESLGEHRHAPHVEIIPSPKTCTTNETRVDIKTIYGNHDGTPLMPPDESRVIENTGPPLFEQTAVSA